MRRAATPRQPVMWIVSHALALMLVALASTPLLARQAVAITDVAVVDVARCRIDPARTVLIDEGRIVAMGRAQNTQIPEQALRVNGRGKYLIPGLVDMHVHLFNLSSGRAPNEWTFPLFIANGVTSVRDMRSDAASMKRVTLWRKTLDAGDIVMPRIIAAGIAVSASSRRDAAEEVAAAADAGADFIKVFSEVPAARWRAIVAAAKARGLPVAGHVPAGVTLLEAAAAGQVSSEHLMQAYEACSSREVPLMRERDGLEGDALSALRDAQEAHVLATFDRRVCRRAAAALSTTGMAQVPTLVLANEDTLAGTALSVDPRWRWLRADERSRWERFLAAYTPDDAALAHARWPVAHRIVATMQRAGVSILAGTDTPMPGVYPGFSLHEELAMLVEAGLTPCQALRAATLAPAEFLGVGAMAGSIDIGKRADFVLLDANPISDIRNTQRIDAVLLDGRLLKREDLDALLGSGVSVD